MLSANGLKVELGRRYRFAASHRLHSVRLSDAENARIYGKCNNPHGHGHNYRVEVSVRGAIDPATGMVINLADLDGVVVPQVVERFHLANLNADPLFEREVPTTENLCRVIYRLLAGKLPVGELDRVRIEETENNFFEFQGETV
jgi:6-pyruvoyltetrahydropterin/6-carboxytetrahydropterin synthase